MNDFYNEMNDSLKEEVSVPKNLKLQFQPKEVCDDVLNKTEEKPQVENEVVCEEKPQQEENNKAVEVVPSLELFDEEKENPQEVVQPEEKEVCEQVQQTANTQQMPEVPMAPTVNKIPQPPTNPFVTNPYFNQNPSQQTQQARTPVAPIPTQIPPQMPKEKMSGTLKAVVIIIIALLVACIAAYGIHVFGNRNQNGFVPDTQTPTQSPTEGYTIPDYGFDFDFGFDDEAVEEREYPETNAKDKVNKNYSGVDLKSKPKKIKNYGASYSFNRLQNSVVGVVCYYEEDEGTDTYKSQGTGIILTTDGYIVTNSHVIGNSRKAYLVKVITADKKEYKAGVVGYDSRSDLAVLKIDGKNLPYAEFGNSDETQVTEDVIAIGNPNGLDFQNSVTKGIVSALNRKVSSSNNVEFLQIDAPINPGNSGGPLCNMYGQVIGITTSKIASDVYEGMGFAIPSTTMKKIVDDIIRNGYVTNRVKIGISGIAVYEENEGASGIQIEEIVKGGPMDGCGVKVKDIITAVDGKTITTFAEVFDILEQHKEGDKVTVSVYRPFDRKTYDFEIVLQVDKAED